MNSQRSVARSINLDSAPGKLQYNPSLKPSFNPAAFNPSAQSFYPSQSFSPASHPAHQHPTSWPENAPGAPAFGSFKPGSQLASPGGDDGGILHRTAPLGPLHHPQPQNLDVHCIPLLAASPLPSEDAGVQLPGSFSQPLTSGRYSTVAGEGSPEPRPPPSLANPFIYGAPGAAAFSSCSPDQDGWGEN